jgi:hypothetical protein
LTIYGTEREGMMIGDKGRAEEDLQQAVRRLKLAVKNEKMMILAACRT